MRLLLILFFVIVLPLVSLFIVFSFNIMLGLACMLLYCILLSIYNYILSKPRRRLGTENEYNLYK